MDWPLIIDRNRDALLRLLAVVFAMAGVAQGAVIQVLPRAVRTEIWGVLRPAEAAFRRLLVVAVVALEITAGGGSARAAPAFTGKSPGEIPQGPGARIPAFALFDRRKRFDLIGKKPVTRGNPRLWMPGMDAPVFTTKTVALPDDPVSAERLFRRVMALQRALADLPKQARRLARWQARREHTPPASGIMRPMRPGRPPGHRARGKQAADEILGNCHALALYVLNPPDT